MAAMTSKQSQNQQDRTFFTVQVKPQNGLDNLETEFHVHVLLFTFFHWGGSNPLIRQSLLIKNWKNNCSKKQEQAECKKFKVPTLKEHFIMIIP